MSEKDLRLRGELGLECLVSGCQDTMISHQCQPLEEDFSGLREVGLGDDKDIMVFNLASYGQRQIDAYAYGGEEDIESLASLLREWSRRRPGPDSGFHHAIVIDGPWEDKCEQKRPERFDACEKSMVMAMKRESRDGVEAKRKQTFAETTFLRLDFDRVHITDQEKSTGRPSMGTPRLSLAPKCESRRGDELNTVKCENEVDFVDQPRERCRSRS